MVLCHAKFPQRLTIGSENSGGLVRRYSRHSVTFGISVSRTFTSLGSCEHRGVKELVICRLSVLVQSYRSVIDCTAILVMLRSLYKKEHDLICSVLEPIFTPIFRYN